MKPSRWLLAIPLLLASPALAQFGDAPSPEVLATARAKWPDVQFEITTPRSSYPLGENIPVTMHYNNAGKAGLRVWVVTYDRSGRIMEFGFNGLHAKGQRVRDPFAFSGGMMGGIRTEQALGKYEQTVSLNEWLAFDHPGHYEITAWSDIVEEVGAEGTHGPSGPLQSAPLQLDITAPDESSRIARLETARVALDAAETRAKTLLPTQDDFEREQALGSHVNDALRDLRWMIDPRAIPLLLRGLELGGTPAFEAHRGLSAFPNMAPVRAAIVARLKTGQPVTQGTWYFKNLLAMSASLSTKSPSFPGLAPEDQALFNAPLRTSLTHSIEVHDTKAAALAAATLLENDEHSSSEAQIWRAFWSGASSLSEGQQWTGAVLLLQEKERARTYPVTTAELRRAAYDAKVGQQLRSAAVLALTKRGDASLRPLLAQDVTAPQPHFTTAAYATLGTFRARPIAVELLRQLRVPDQSSSFAKDDVAKRIRDFGSGATLAELVSATRWVMVQFPESQGPLLEAVALRNPQVALTLVRESLAKRPTWEYGDARLGVLVRLDVPAARQQVRTLLRQKNQNVLEALVGQIGASSTDATPVPEYVRSGERRLRAPRALSESLVPELAHLAFGSPSMRVRRAALDALTFITQMRGVPSDVEQMTAWKSELRVWWQHNASRLGRTPALADSF